jgi:hypothetical protein
MGYVVYTRSGQRLECATYAEAWRHAIDWWLKGEDVTILPTGEDREHFTTFFDEGDYE